MEHKKHVTEYTEYDNFEELTPTDQQLVLQAKEASGRSYAPYSQFNVGAALLLENGQIIQGNNQENAAYPSGLCAERVAIFYANSRFPDVAIETIAIVAQKQGNFIDNPIPPCGACRQVMLESEIHFQKPIRVILYGNKRIQVLKNATSLLPMNFDASFLTN